MVSYNGVHIDQTADAQTGWRKIVLQPSFYAYLVGVFLLSDAVLSLLLNPIDFNRISAIETIQLTYLGLGIFGLIVLYFSKSKTYLIYTILLLIMVFPVFIIKNELMDVRMSLHYVPIAFLVQVGQQNKKLNYQVFIMLTLLMLIFFLILVLEPNINIDETSTALKIQMSLSMVYSAILIFLGILAQKARSYYIIIEKELIEQIGYVTKEFSKTTPFQSSLEDILEDFQTKTSHFFNQSKCRFILNSDIRTTVKKKDLASTYFQSLSDLKNPLFDKLLKKKKTLLYGNAHSQNQLPEIYRNEAAILLVPILLDEKVIGIIEVMNPAPYFFNESHQHLTEIIASLCASKILEFQHRQLNYQAIALELQRKQLEELDELKHTFIENISKNIQAPIQSILGDSALLNQQITTEGSQKLAELIYSNSSQLKGIIDQLLQLNEIDVRSVELELAPIDLGGLMTTWGSTFRRIAARRNITFSIEGPHSLTAVGDEKKLTSIIHNLINNALKYTPENGQVEVLYKLKDNQFFLEVNDSGLGIPEIYRERIFDRFFRLGEADGQGTGIGLSIVKELAELLGGEVRVEKADLGGASFKFTYHLQFIEELYTPNSVDHTEGLLAALPANKPVVLVIDDHTEMREFICSCLSKDFHCVQSENGRNGLAKMKTIIPDLVITDLMMPEMTGEELCKAVRTDEALNHIPIVVLSAKSTGANKVNLYEIGADNYLVKPFEVDELVAIVQSLLQIRNQLRIQFKARFLTTDSVAETYESKARNFLETVNSIILANLSNSDFNTVLLCGELGLGRNQFGRKIKALTHMTPVEFIRETRLKEAAQLLDNGALSISEVAYQTGFNNLSYFTKTFKHSFGVLPSGYKTRGKSDHHKLPR